MKKRLFITLLGFIFSLSLAAYCADNINGEKKVVRVGISNQKFSTYEHARAKFISESAIIITDMSNNEKFDSFEPNQTIEISMENGMFNIYRDRKLLYHDLNGPLVINSNAQLGIVDLDRKGTPAKYDGMLELRATKNNSGFHIINILDMNTYIRGVIPNEMPVSFGLEALKAQSIAAKNYAQNSSINPYYDVVDSTSSQVYYGANSYKTISDRAVNETLGVYALYKGKPISALYFSTSPGITDDWDDVFGSGIATNTYPYLKASYDKAGQKALKSENDVREFYSSQEGGIDRNSPKYRWTVEFERSELEEILHNNLITQSKAGLVSPKYDGTNKLKGLRELKAQKRTQSGKITELLIKADSGDYVVKKELGIRRVLRKEGSMLPSANFFVDTDNVIITKETVQQEKKEENKTEKKAEQIKKEEKPQIALPTGKKEIFAISESDKPKQKSNSDVKARLKGKIEPQKEEPKEVAKEEIPVATKVVAKQTNEKYPKFFKLTGGGFGHGVGMSQFGAYNMAKAGQKYPAILKHYYKGIVLSTLPKTVYFNEYNVWYKTDFYFDKNVYKSAYLYVDNQKGVSEFPFKVNNYDFLETKKIAINKVIKMDITQYLAQGVNSVNFAPLILSNKGKSIVYRIEFQ